MLALDVPVGLALGGEQQGHARPLGLQIGKGDIDLLEGLLGRINDTGQGLAPHLAHKQHGSAVFKRQGHGTGQGPGGYVRQGFPVHHIDADPQALGQSLKVGFGHSAFLRHADGGRGGQLAQMRGQSQTRNNRSRKLHAYLLGNCA